MDRKAIEEGYDMAKRARLVEGGNKDAVGVASNAGRSVQDLVNAIKAEDERKIRRSLHEALDNLSFLTQELARVGLLEDPGDKLIDALEKAEAASR